MLFFCCTFFVVHLCLSCTLWLQGCESNVQVPTRKGEHRRPPNTMAAATDAELMAATASVASLELTEKERAITDPRTCALPYFPGTLL